MPELRSFHNQTNGKERIRKNRFIGGPHAKQRAIRGGIVLAIPWCCLVIGEKGRWL
jgi:hypothetical protein